MKHKKLFRLALSAMLMALGLVLSLLTGQIPQIGNMLLPMHLPVFFCGLICGWQYGLAVGAITPLLRAVTFGMPILFPNAVAMSVELAVYGFTVGFLYSLFKKKTLLSLYISLISAMLAGRALWGAVYALLLGVSGGRLTFAAFLASAFTAALPGIFIQLILIPSVMLALRRTHLLLPKNKGESRGIDEKKDLPRLS